MLRTCVWQKLLLAFDWPAIHPERHRIAAYNPVQGFAEEDSQQRFLRSLGMVVDSMSFVLPLIYMAFVGTQ